MATESLQPPSSVTPSFIKSSARLRRRQFVSKAFAFVCMAITMLAFAALIWLLWGIFKEGFHRLSWEFLNSFPSRRAENAGIKAALYGSVYVLLVAMAFSVPIGIGAAIFLQEYSERNKFAQFAQVNIANLAGVPSIVYGILGLALFVRLMNLERSVLAGGLTLGVLVMPVIIITAQEALRAVPSSLREGSYALGATRWQTISRQVLPVAMPGILTGIILSLARAMGEVAPLILMGALTYVAFVPESLRDSFTVLPIQIFNWTGRPQEAFQEIAAAGIIVLLGVLLSLNAVAIFLRYRFSRNR